ncbi:hypothetical protein EYF80_032011 [Liparis tanakae]|uniref:Uncharacterized protein n=1 Tax=Liparis tanakae TaxID=230148 RepID=A0A4Z2GY87_9TELE|nr:hypothetical protein EYF80_032011 [Liparis tanakae]
MALPPSLCLLPGLGGILYQCFHLHWCLRVVGSATSVCLHRLLLCCVGFLWPHHHTGNSLW